MTLCALIGAACLLLLGVVVWLSLWVRALRRELEARKLAARLAYTRRIRHEIAGVA